MNDFDKTFALVLYNSFLKIKSNCDKEDYVNFKYMQFSKDVV